MEKINDEYLIENFKQTIENLIPEDNLKGSIINKKENLIENTDNLKAFFRGWVGTYNFEDVVKISAFISNFFELTLDVLSEIIPLNNLEELINNLTEIYNGLAEAHNQSFQIKEFKRDNLIHQVRVFLLGIYIISKNWDYWIKHIKIDIKNTDLKLYKRIKSITGHITKETRDRFFRTSFLVFWGVTALFHDCGKVYEPFFESIIFIMKHFALPINKSLLKSKFFLSMSGQNPSKNECSFVFSKVMELSTSLCNFDIMGVINNTKDKICLPDCFIYPKDASNFSNDLISTLKYLNITESLNLPIDCKLIKDILPSVIKESRALELVSQCLNKYLEYNIISCDGNDFTYPDHGVLSAAIVLFFCNFYDSKFELKCVGTLSTWFFFMALIAIATHSDFGGYGLNCFSRLLIICDQLQEWDRVTCYGDKKIKLLPCKDIEIEIENNNNQLNINAKINYNKNLTFLVKEQSGNIRKHDCSLEDYNNFLLLNYILRIKSPIEKYEYLVNKINKEIAAKLSVLDLNVKITFNWQIVNGKNFTFSIKKENGTYKAELM